MESKWPKSRVGKWLLLSLIPATVLFWIAVAVASSIDGGVSILFSVVIFLLVIYWPAALVAGIVLRWLGSKDNSGQYLEAQQYAQRHGWHPISETMWRNRKRNGVQLAVNQAIGKRTYILTIAIEGETTMVDEFTRAVWALDFGDWLWEELLEARGAATVEVVEEKRAEWEQSRGLALYRPR